MLTVKKEFFANLEVKKSKFISHIVPFSKFEKRLKELKEEHTKARHFVTAVRYFGEHGRIVENSSDDKEPRGTAGKPMLNVLRGKELVEVGAITIRYFGGVKLGTGGLVKAYSDSLNEALKEAELIEFAKKTETEISVSYSDMNRLVYKIKELDDIDIINRDFKSDSVSVKIGGKEEHIEKIKKLFG